MDHDTASGAYAASRPRQCAVCHEEVAPADAWSGEIGSSTLCVACARTLVGFWQDDLDGAVVSTEVSPPAPDSKRPTRRLWRTTCLGCGAPALVFESTSHSGLCPGCLETLRGEVDRWRARRRA